MNICSAFSTDATIKAWLRLMLADVIRKALKKTKDIIIAMTHTTRLKTPIWLKINLLMYVTVGKCSSHSPETVEI